MNKRVTIQFADLIKSRLAGGFALLSCVAGCLFVSDVLSGDVCGCILGFPLSFYVADPLVGHSYGHSVRKEHMDCPPR